MLPDSRWGKALHISSIEHQLPRQLLPLSDFRKLKNLRSLQTSCLLSGKHAANSVDDILFVDHRHLLKIDVVWRGCVQASHAFDGRV
jgi:hypothetical protein